ncbi:MAG TPA: helix-turn-helix domain-containing protein [Hyphomicrobiaceae bacterium]|nr:helix-turn-helix domain-containing protein [Hyphomicrobiaceae bacterium]
MPAKKPVRTRKNLRAADREKMILEAAIRFFAEHGFGGQTRELAKRIGITHSAIYRHFPSKEVLVERVYEHVYLSPWQAHWATLIKDSSQPLEARLTQFYREYAERIFNYEWVRIFAFSGMKSFGITKRYLAIVADRIIVPAVIEARKELGLPPPSHVPITERERELFWGLHGRIFYIAVRKFVYDTPVPEKLDDIIADAAHEFMAGAPHVLRRILAAKQ